MKSEAEEKTGRHRRLILAGFMAVVVLAGLAGWAIAPSITFLPGQPAPEDSPRNGRGNNPGQKPLLTEFGDFQCPHCARFGLTVLPLLERDLVEPGTIRFEYRHYPFLGPESFAAAEASECARDQGRFREYHDGLLELTARDERFTLENLAKIAGGLELDPARFHRCLENGERRARVLGDREYGSSLGVLGTPSLFLDGKLLQWRNYRDLRQQIIETAKSKQMQSSRE